MSDNNDHLFVERRPDGDYAVSWGDAKRASAIERTQKEAIDRAKEIDPKAPLHVERVRNTERGTRDHWRNP